MIPPIFLFRIFVNKRLHFVQFLNHVPCQYQMAFCSHKILVGIVNFKILIAVDIIGQEAHTAFHRHRNRTKGKGITFRIRNRTLYRTYKAARKGFVFLHVDHEEHRRNQMQQDQA